MKEPTPKDKSFLKKAYDAAKEIVDETKDDADNLRGKHIQPLLDAGKNRIIGAGAGAKIGFVIGMKGGPKGMAIGIAFGAAVGLIGGKPAVEGVERGIDKLFGRKPPPEEANDNVDAEQQKPENKVDGNPPTDPKL